MFALSGPLAQLLLDSINTRNNVNLTLDDVVLSDPEPIIPNGSGDTVVRLTIPARGSSISEITYFRWDINEFYDAHDRVYEVPNAGTYTLSDVLDLVNGRLQTQLTEAEFVDGQWDVEAGDTVVELTAAPSNILLYGTLNLTLRHSST